MLESFLVVGQQVAVLFILVFTGYLCAKSGFFSHTTVMGLTNLIMYVVTPCIIILSFQREFDAGMLGALGVASLIAAGFHLLGILLAHSLIRDKVARRRRVLRFGVVFSNAGTMSLPLQQAILGLDGVFYGAAVIAVFNLVLWTYGLVLMSGDTKKNEFRKPFAKSRFDRDIRWSFVLYLLSESSLRLQRASENDFCFEYSFTHACNRFLSGEV
ncbi:MAG: hypothetical protein GX804_00375 [Lentisphaerae bacterium]|nr:hypothetical protein [Lentisphaerota bacterium]